MDTRSDSVKLKLLVNANNFELGLIQGILEDNGISAIIKDSPGGDYQRIIFGYTVFGTDVYVREEDYPRAKELWDAYVSGGYEAPDENEDETQEQAP